MPPCHGGDRGFDPRRDRQCGSVAQLVEQRIEDPCVGGSIPSRATIIKTNKHHCLFFYFIFFGLVNNV